MTTRLSRRPGLVICHCDPRLASLCENQKYRAAVEWQVPVLAESGGRVKPRAQALGQIEERTSRGAAKESDPCRSYSFALSGLRHFATSPTACAVGFTLSPLRGLADPQWTTRQ